MSVQLKDRQWISVEERLPHCYESGHWDGLRSDFVVIKTAKNIYEVVRLYHGFFDRSEFKVWATSEDFEVEQVIHWMSLPDIPIK